MVYADFESIPKPANEDVDVTQGIETGIESSSHVFQEHMPCSFAYKIVSIQIFHDLLSCIEVKTLLKCLYANCNWKQLFDEYIAAPIPMLLTATESQSFINTTICHICTTPLGVDKVQDHYHITGNYRGATHNECNLNYRIKPNSWKLPVVIHNLKGYDGHLIVKGLKSEFGKVRVILQNMEKYLSLRVGQLKFIDSFQFTPQGLDKPAKTLEDDELGT